MIHRPLAGRTFILTRPRQNITSLAEKLRHLGAQVLEMPTIRTVPIADNMDLENALKAKADICWMVFTSAIGVDVFFEKLQQMNRDIRMLFSNKSQIKFAVIGEATGQRLRTYGLCPDLMPEVYDARHLGAQLARRLDTNSEVLILRAKQGSKELIPPLREAGLLVKDIPLYDTIYETPTAIDNEIIPMIREGCFDAVIFTSGSTVRGFVERIQEKEIRKPIRAICIGNQTAAAAKENEMTVQIAEKASEDSIIECVLQNYGRSESC